MSWSSRKKFALFVTFILSEGNLFSICVLFQCIVHWINSQDIYTFIYQKVLIHTLLLLAFKIVESLKNSAILKKICEIHSRSNCSWMFFKKSVLKNFAILTGKQHLCFKSLFNKVAGLKVAASVTGNPLCSIWLIKYCQIQRNVFNERLFYIFNELFIYLTNNLFSLELFIYSTKKMYFRRTTNGGRMRRSPLPFFENKSALILEKSALFVYVHLWVKFSFKIQF